MFTFFSLFLKFVKSTTETQQAITTFEIINISLMLVIIVTIIFACLQIRRHINLRPTPILHFYTTKVESKEENIKYEILRKKYKRLKKKIKKLINEKNTPPKLLSLEYKKEIILEQKEQKINNEESESENASFGSIQDDKKTVSKTLPLRRRDRSLRRKTIIDL